MSGFKGELFDGDFPYSGVFSSEIRGDTLPTLRVHVVSEPDWAIPAEVVGVVERIRPDMFLEFTGSADLPLSAQIATVPFDGTFAVRLAEAVVSSKTYRCPVPPVTCRSPNHGLVWTRQ